MKREGVRSYKAIIFIDGLITFIIGLSMLYWIPEYSQIFGVGGFGVMFGMSMLYFLEWTDKKKIEV
jgi:hypothetical protein